MAVDSPNHRGDDGRLLCRGMISVVQLAGSALQLITVSLTGTCGNTAVAAAAEDMNGLSTGIADAAAGPMSALKLDKSCVTANTPPSSTCKMTQMSST